MVEEGAASLHEASSDFQLRSQKARVQQEEMFSTSSKPVTQVQQMTQQLVSTYGMLTISSCAAVISPSLHTSIFGEAMAVDQLLSFE